MFNPLKSKLICDAKERGLVATGGLYMLVSQAAYAVEKFIESPVNDSEVEKIFNNLYKNKMNFVIIGMPASGKTSVGKELEKVLNKSFVDTDELIVEKTNKSIPDIFKDSGEKAFREIEKDVIYNIIIRPEKDA